MPFPTEGGVILTTCIKRSLGANVSEFYYALRAHKQSAALPYLLATPLAPLTLLLADGDIPSNRDLVI